MRPRLGVLVGAKEPVAELPATVRAAEAAGYDELWLAEDCFLHGGLTAAATALALTERLTVGTGLLPAAVLLARSAPEMRGAARCARASRACSGSRERVRACPM